MYDLKTGQWAVAMVQGQAVERWSCGFVCVSVSGRWSSLWDVAAACCGCVPVDETLEEATPSGSRPPPIVVRPVEPAGAGKARSPANGIKPTPA